MRFIHTADIHLGAPFKRVGADDPDVRERLLSASAKAFVRVVDIAIDRGVDFVVVAGDALDGSERRPAAQLLFQREMARLDDAGIATYMARGNHDPSDGWSAGLKLPPRVHVFGTDRVESVVHEREGTPVCTIYGRSYPIRQVTENYAAGYRRAPEDTYAIGVLHANVGGREGWEEYAPCSLDDLRQAAMDYWALGHIHGYDVIMDDPPAIYPGSPQGIDPAETGPHGCVLVTVTNGVTSHEFVETAPIRWATVPVDISSAEGLDDVNQAIFEALEDVAGASGTSGTIARLRLEGRCAAHASIAGEGAQEDLLAYVREKGMSLSPWVWVDKLADGSAGLLDIDSMRTAEGFLGDLVRHADGLDPEAALAEALDELRAKLGALPTLELDSTDAVTAARDLCLDLLASEEGSR